MIKQDFNSGWVVQKHATELKQCAHLGPQQRVSLPGHGMDLKEKIV